MAAASTMRCYLVTKDAPSGAQAGIHARPTSELPAGDVLVRVAWSSLNYKDALAATGHPGVVRVFPHVPGIDAAGTVVESSSPDWKPGQQVVITGFELGSGRWGGYAEFVRVPAAWLVALPPGLDLRSSMIFGTAGFTAAQSVAALLHNDITPASGEVVVTGASGGVGCIAVSILARLGYKVTAVSGKPQARELLTQLGAAQIIGRQEIIDTSGKPLLAGRWAGAVDTVGGETLASILRGTQSRGCVTACGLVGGVDLPLTVYPFILRGASLVGIDSATCPRPLRLDLWSKLAGPWKPADLDSLTTEIGFDGLAENVARILAGGMMGRIVVRVQD